MSIADDLRTIAECARSELNAVHDFFEHSKVVWRSFQKFTEEGHRVVVENSATGSRTDQDGLVRLTKSYTRAYLATFTFRQFVSTFEGFLFNFLYRLLLHNPWQFAKSQVEFEAVLKASNRDDIISGVVQKQLNALKYENLREWFVALNKAVKLDGPSEDAVERLAEIKAARDILEHNAGVVNETYLRKAGKQARYLLGDQIEIDDAYHLESWLLIKSVLTSVTAAAVAQLGTA